MEITHSVQAFQRSSTAEDHLRLVIDSAPALVHTALPDGYLDFFNQTWLNYLGVSLQDVAGWKWTGAIHAEDVAAILEKWRTAEGIFIMSAELPAIYLVRHGETARSLTGERTGLTDLPLTERGERNARGLGERLNELNFLKVFTSPLQRARRTCELAGFGTAVEVDRDLVEWN